MAVAAAAAMRGDFASEIGQAKIEIGCGGEHESLLRVRGRIGRIASQREDGRDEQLRLIVFADDPQVPLDNNATERGLRGIAIGRRVHFGSKSRRGTQVAAIFYTLIESAKAWGVDARGYLRAAMLAARAGVALTPGGYAAYLGQDEVRVDGADSLAQPPSG